LLHLRLSSWKVSSNIFQTDFHQAIDPVIVVMRLLVLRLKALECALDIATHLSAMVWKSSSFKSSVWISGKTGSTSPSAILNGSSFRTGIIGSSFFSFLGFFSGFGDGSSSSFSRFAGGCGLCLPETLRVSIINITYE
jgi:hypothetical protein